MRNSTIRFFVTLFLLTWQYTAFAKVVSYGVETDIFHPVYAKQGMVASIDTLATEVGVDILKQGGNAVDAAVAVGFALAVTYPQAGNIGGGGFMVLKTKEGKVTTIDFRETAPSKASRDMYLNEKGEVNSRLSLTSHLASGVPGTVAGFDLALEKYGTMPLAKVLEPAIKLANDGFIVNETLAKDLARYGPEVMIYHPNSQAIFFKPSGISWQYGERFYQKDLARSLTLIAQQGASAFYKGEIAQQIVKQMAENAGLITLEDLSDYKAIEREPVTGTYKGYQIYSMPAPSSGGIHIIQLLNILESFDLKNMGQNSAAAIHTMSQAMKYAYADRSEYLGDPDFVNVPTKELTSKTYAKSIAAQIDLKKNRPSTEIHPGKIISKESDQTTHFSVVDKQGNAVAVTYTLNTNFGSGIVAGNSGILLNNQMDDFSAKPNTPNVYGLIGGEANSIQPRKRPLSSMSPTIVTKEGKTVLITGSPGGSRIITTVLQILLNMLEFEMNIAEATNAPRVHHQWYPDTLRVEKSISIDTINLLKEKGHIVEVKPVMGNTQSIMIDANGFYGASDPRKNNGLTAGY